MDTKEPPLVSTQFREGGDRRRGDRRRAPRLGQGERRRGDRRGAVARAGLLLAALGLLAHGRGLRGRPEPIPVTVGEHSGDRPPVPREAPPPPATPYDHIIQEAADLYHVNVALIRAVIQTESGFDPRARSHAGARGLMQLTPRTARAVGIKNPLDPRQNILGGTRYLSILLDRFDGDVRLALASYNAGPTAVRRHGGIPPFKETLGYVSKIESLLADAAPTAD